MSAEHFEHLELVYVFNKPNKKRSLFKRLEKRSVKTQLLFNVTDFISSALIYNMYN